MQLDRKILATLMCMASLVSSRPLLSEEPSNLQASAVDAQGVRHSSGEHGKKKAPWSDDAIYCPRPLYPPEVRDRHITGSGLFRLTLDLSTGSVAKVAVIKSAGHPILDDSAIQAFRQWRWKPGRWKEIDIPITFTMGGPPRPLHPPGAKPTPPQR
jgi:TonB family protein